MATLITIVVILAIIFGLLTAFHLADIISEKPVECLVFAALVVAMYFWGVKPLLHSYLPGMF